jgi:hypothetical protein
VCQSSFPIVTHVLKAGNPGDRRCGNSKFVLALVRVCLP